MGSTISKPRTIQQDQIRTNTIVAVRGNIEYSRLVRPVDGDDLVRDRMRRQQQGLTPIDKPFTTVTIVNARVLPRDPSGMMTNEELYVDQRLYRRVAEGPNAPWRHSSINKLVNEPNKFYMARNGQYTEADQIFPDKELANGLDVVLLLRIYETAQFQKKGLGLTGIILMEPLRYFTGSTDQAVADAGITLHSAPNPNPKPAPAVASVPAAPQVDSPTANPYSSDTANAGYPQQPQGPAYQAPAPQQAAYPQQPQAPAYPTQPQAPAYQAPAPQGYPQQPQAPAQQPSYPAQPQAPAYQAPAPAPQAPAAQPAAPAANEWTCPTCGTRVPMGMAFCGSCGTHRPDNTGSAPAGGGTVPAQPGINYDPNQRDY